MYRRLLDEMKFRAWTKLLCVDCGDGWVAEEAWRRLGRGCVCGVDRSSDMIEVAAVLRGVAGQIEFQTWDGIRLPFGEAAFDYAVSCFALNRYAEPASVLRELRRVIKPNGELYLLEPDRNAFGGLYRLWDRWFWLIDPGHVRYYSTAELARMLEENGFGQITVPHHFEGVLRGGKILATATILRGRALGTE